MSGDINNFQIITGRKIYQLPEVGETVDPNSPFPIYNLSSNRDEKVPLKDAGDLILSKSDGSLKLNTQTIYSNPYGPTTYSRPAIDASEHFLKSEFITLGALPSDFHHVWLPEALGEGVSPVAGLSLISVGETGFGIVRTSSGVGLAMLQTIGTQFMTGADDSRFGCFAEDCGIGCYFLQVNDSQGALVPIGSSVQATRGALGLLSLGGSPRGGNSTVGISPIDGGLSTGYVQYQSNVVNGVDYHTTIDFATDVRAGSHSVLYIEALPMTESDIVASGGYADVFGGSVSVMAMQYFDGTVATKTRVEAHMACASFGYSLNGGFLLPHGKGNMTQGMVEAGGTIGVVNGQTNGCFAGGYALGTGKIDGAPEAGETRGSLVYGIARADELHRAGSDGCAVFGRRNVAQNVYTLVSGIGVITKFPGERTFSGNSVVADVGKRQAGELCLSVSSSGTTVTDLLAADGLATLALSAGLYDFTVEVTGIATDSSIVYAAQKRFIYLSTGSALTQQGSTQVIGTDINASAIAGVALSVTGADLKLTVAGAAAKTMKWNARLQYNFTSNA